MTDMTETVLYSEEDREMLEEYENKKSRRPDDVIAMQTAVCMTAALVLLLLRLFCPDTAEALLNGLKKNMTDTSFVFANPIDTVISYLQNR